VSVVKGFFGSFVVRGAAVLSKRVWGRSRALQPVLSYLTLSAVRLLSQFDERSTRSLVTSKGLFPLSSAFSSEAVTPMKVDITGNNRQGNQKLVEVGRRTIPYLVVYSPDGKQVFASDAYTVDQVLKALKEAEAPL